MRIRTSANKYRLLALSAGDAFYYDGILYMKIRDFTYSDRNAVYLETGTTTYISEDALVELAKVHIEDDKE